jgi:hypothetical protein
MTIKEFDYSLIIPTRNRQHTALAAIQSAISCDYDKLQIIVADNSDDDSLKQQIAQRGWMRHVTYRKTDRVLPMHENWGMGLDLSQGQYVSIIGDDDGIFPDALVVCNALLNLRSSKVVVNVSAEYKWPDYPYPGRRNSMNVPLGCQITFVSELHQLLRDAVAHKLDLGTGPGIYKGFVERNFLETLKQKRGAWFVEHQPDLDSGYCTLMYADGFLMVTRPLFMDGHCGKSNSAAMRSATVLEMSVRTYSQEAGVNCEELFPHEALKTTRGALVGGQYRLLGEIRSVLKDKTIDVDRQAAWEYLAAGVAQGYDMVNLRRHERALQDLAIRWGLEAKVEPTKFVLAESVHEEQGLYYGPTSNKKVATKTHTTERPTYVRINCEAAGLKNINDAIDLAKGMIAPLKKLTEGKVNEAYKYLIGHRFKHHAALIQEAQHAANNHQLIVAEELVLRVCTENCENTEAFVSLGNIRLQLGSLLGASTAFSRAMSLKPTFQVAERYVWVLCQLGLLESALEIIEIVRPDASGGVPLALVQSMESHVKALKQRLMAADSKRNSQ